MRRARPADAAAVRIDPVTGWAWRGDERLDLTPKAFAVLRHLVGRPQHLVTKDELLAAAWGETVVSEAAITSCIRDLRRALADSSRAPRYIETVHRRGFRFIGPVATAPRMTPGPAAAALPPASGTLVGRDAELARLDALLAAAAAGRRRIVFVTGEAGIGKTTLVETFLARLGDRDGVRIGRGQCVEQYGASEPYLPVLEAVGRMGREPRGRVVVDVLKQYAPTWLVQLPALLTDDEMAAVQRRASGTTRERMLRELVDALDALAAEAPLVLLLEDLHWSDAATIDLLAMIARRRDAARLLIAGTYRPADVEASAHPLKPLKEELELHGQCDELALHFLDEQALREYLDRRFTGAAFPPAFARVVHGHTNGNPLFVVNVVDDLLAQAHIRRDDGGWELAIPVERVASGVPRTLGLMVERQVERLTPREQAVLAVGSVAGAEFSAALATVDGIDPHEAERCCDALARRRQFLRALGAVAWPDGTVSGHYAFIHALYRNVLYERITVGHRVGLHLRIGARLEAAHGAHAADIAGELAMHFEEGRDFERAVRHRTEAADAALRRHAYREAVQHASRARDLLAALPKSADVKRQELAIQTMLGAAAVATYGWAASDVATAYERARELCGEIGVTPQVFPVLVGLAGFYLMRGNVLVAEAVSAELLRHAEATDDAAGQLGGHNHTGLALFYRGRFEAAVPHLERARAIYDPERHSPNREFSVDHDEGVSSLAHSALTLLMLGHLDRAAAFMRECLALAVAIDHPLSIAMAYNFAATFYQARRETEVVAELEAVRAEYAKKHDFDVFLLLGEIYRGWLAVERGEAEEGLAQIEHGLMAYRAIGAELGRPTFLGILADVYYRLGRTEDAMATLDEAVALADKTGLHYWDADLRRLKGTFLLRSDPAAAESSFVEAIEIARGQGAKWHELRAATGLARLWQRQGDRKRAYSMLSEICGWFTEGFETPDVLDASVLLGDLGAASGEPGRARR